MSQAKERIHFTVSMWNRFNHLRILMDDLAEIKQLDDNIALHVCAFEGTDATFEELEQAVGNAPCESYLTYRTDTFGNGLGHNLATMGVSTGDIVCHVAVDICMPVDITQRVRANVVRDEAVYFPAMFQQCRDGRLETRGGGGALIGLYKTDWFVIGGFSSPRMPWEGDHEISSAEDVLLGNRLEELKFKINRPREQDLFCRWHKRFLSNPFYRTLRGKRVDRLVSWLNVFRDDGTEITK